MAVRVRETVQPLTIQEGGIGTHRGWRDGSVALMGWLTLGYCYSSSRASDALS